VQSNNNAGNDAPRRASELRHRISFLAASHAMLDEIDQARWAIGELLRLQPNCSIQYVNKLPKYAHQADQGDR